MQELQSTADALCGTLSRLKVPQQSDAMEKQLTFDSGGHILTNAAVWSPDGQWIVYDTRSDIEGAVFDGENIEIINVESGEVRRIYQSKNGAHCGVATFHPHQSRVVFIVGPQYPTPDWAYDAAHRQGVIVDLDSNRAINLDARDLTPPFTRGALRGGSHLHEWSGDGLWVRFTYHDALLARFDSETDGHDSDARNIGISAPLGKVRVSSDHARNHAGEYFSVLVTRTSARARAGSDEIRRASEESWIGTRGYRRADGRRQNRAIAFQGEVVTNEGEAIAEVFIVDVPDDVTQPSPDGPLEGTSTKRPLPPLGTTQRRLSFTAERRFPGLQGPRHWLRSSPDGTQIAFLMRDDLGVVQLWTISPRGGAPRQITSDTWSVASTFTWNGAGSRIAYIADNSVFVVEAQSGETCRLTPRVADADAPLPLACVFSPEGKRIAFGRRVVASSALDSVRFNQIFMVTLPQK